MDCHPQPPVSRQLPAAVVDGHANSSDSRLRSAVEAANLYKRWPNFSRDEKRSIVESITEKIILGKDKISITLCCMPSSDLLTKRQRHLARCCLFMKRFWRCRATNIYQLSTGEYQSQRNPPPLEVTCGNVGFSWASSNPQRRASYRSAR